MKIALESALVLTDSDLEEIVDIWNRKSRRIFQSSFVNCDSFCNVVMNYDKALCLVGP